MADFLVYSSAMERTPAIDVADGILTASTIIERKKRKATYGSNATNCRVEFEMSMPSSRPFAPVT